MPAGCSVARDMLLLQRPRRPLASNTGVSLGFGMMLLCSLIPTTAVQKECGFFDATCSSFTVRSSSLWRSTAMKLSGGQSCRPAGYGTLHLLRSSAFTKEFARFQSTSSAARKPSPQFAHYQLDSSAFGNQATSRRPDTAAFAPMRNRPRATCLQKWTLPAFTRTTLGWRS